MFKYKCFRGNTSNDGITSFESTVNTWLHQTKPRIHSMSQSISGDIIVLSVLFEVPLEVEEHSVLSAASSISETYQELLEENELDAGNIPSEDEEPLETTTP